MKTAEEFRKRNGITFSTTTDGNSKFLKLHYKGKGLVDIDNIMQEFAEQYCEEKECEWTEDIDYEYFATSCGEAYCLLGGTLEDNKHKYCPFCGRRIVLKEQDKSISIDQYMDLNPQIDPHEQSDEEDN